MGNRQSSPAPAAPPPRPPPPPPPPPPTPAQLCALRKVELNQIQNDLNNKQTQVDTCDPQGAQTRLTEAAMAANTAFVTEKRSKFNELLQANYSSRNIYNNVRDAVGPIVTVGSELSGEAERLQGENQKYVRSQRKERRRFLDSDPLAGVGGPPGIHTSDDKVLLAFWITLGLALVLTMIYLLNIYGGSMDMKQKISIGASVVLLSYGIIYYLITQYG